VATDQDWSRFEEEKNTDYPIPGSLMKRTAFISREVPRSLFLNDPIDSGSSPHLNTGTYLSAYTASHAIRQSSSSL
jgi:hypothetical protein